MTIGPALSPHSPAAPALPEVVRSAPTAPVRAEGSIAERISVIVSYMRRNPSLPIGLAMILALGLFLIVGRFFVNLEDARAVSVATLQEPSRELPFGSDRQGRDLFAVMIAGTP